MSTSAHLCGDAGEEPLLASRARARIGALVLLLAALAVLNACASASARTEPPAPLPRTATQTPPPPTPPPTARPTDPPTARPTATASATPRPQPTAVPTPSAEPLSAERRLEVLGEVWELVRDNYVYADYNGVDWEAVRHEFAPRAEAATSDEAFYAALGEMVGRLNDQHSRFGPPALVVSEDAAISGREEGVGIGVVVVPMAEGGFIQTVFPDSSAEQGGLRPRDRILAVDGRPYRREDGDLRGPAGSSVRLNVVRPGEKPRDLVLERREFQAHVAPYYRRFPGEIGYVAVSTLWSPDMDEQVSGALTELMGAGQLNGVVLDLRGNPGGWSHVMTGILSHFVRGQVGVFFDRRAQVRPLVVPASVGPDMRGVPLAVLIDQSTASYAEVIAAILQREANATVIGVASAGNTETIYAYTISDGSRLWLAQEGFRLQNGASLEGHGVEPDAVVDVDWKRYSEDDDPQLLEALRTLGAGPK
ncbi:MAG TPA: S41 family peptidase [Roseiflexaceae bacterium]|nr:S41 family peptidase [Roseiflexaceae bacterium]